MDTWSLPGVERPKLVVFQQHICSARVIDRGELYLYNLIAVRAFFWVTNFTGYEYDTAPNTGLRMTTKQQRLYV